MAGNHRSTADSEAGRRMISPGIVHEPWRVSKEIQEFNRQVDERKAAKKAAKALRKQGAA